MLGKIASLRDSVSQNVKDLAKDALSEAKDALREVFRLNIILQIQIKCYLDYSVTNFHLNCQFHLISPPLSNHTFNFFLLCRVKHWPEQQPNLVTSRHKRISAGMLVVFQSLLLEKQRTGWGRPTLRRF
jgi:hypothetical protein